MTYFELENKIIDILVPVSVFFASVVALFLLLTPFLIIKFILKRRFEWWIVMLCFVASFGIYQAEVWAFWKIMEYSLIKFSEGLLHTF